MPHHLLLVIVWVCCALVVCVLWLMTVKLMLMLQPPVACFWLLQLTSSLVFRLCDSGISFERRLSLTFEEIVMVRYTMSRITHLLHSHSIYLRNQDILRHICPCSKRHRPLSKSRHGRFILIWSCCKDLVGVDSLAVLVLDLQKLLLRVLTVLVSLAWDFVNLILSWGMSDMVRVLWIQSSSCHFRLFSSRLLPRIQRWSNTSVLSFHFGKTTCHCVGHLSKLVLECVQFPLQ